jgi:hypothetical protein
VRHLLRGRGHQGELPLRVSHARVSEDTSHVCSVNGSADSVSVEFVGTRLAQNQREKGSPHRGGVTADRSSAEGGGHGWFSNDCGGD